MSGGVPTLRSQGLLSEAGLWGPLAPRPTLSRASQDVHRIIHSYLPSSIVEYSYYDFVSLIIYDSSEQWNNYLLSHPIAYEILYVEWDRPNGCFRTHYEEEVLENGEIHIVEDFYEVYP